MGKFKIGGQAVIEGVMMKGPSKVCVAVRRPDGGIAIDSKNSLSARDKYKFLDLPFVRGVVVLWESLSEGLHALQLSAELASDGEEEAVSDWEIFSTIAVSVVMAVGLFVVVPTWSMHFLHAWTMDPLWLNLAEGILRMLIFLVYVTIISMMEDIRRVFQYHGAEHKTIYTYEADEELTVENVRNKSTLHPRCGTNFLMIVMLISMFIFTFLGWPNLWLRIVSRLVLMPVIAGVSYEIIRYAGNHCDSPWVHAAILPGLLLQKLTTREPDDDQIEVAIASVKAALAE